MPVAGGLYYEDHGPIDAPALIFSAGLGGSGSYWQPNVTAFIDRFRVILYDHRGTGRSDRALPDIVTVEDMSADLVALMDTLGLATASVIGHALGGMIGIETAIMTTRIDRLVIVNGWRTLDPQTRRCFEVRLGILRDSGPEAYLHAQPLFLFPPDWISRQDSALREEARHQLASFPGAATIQKRIDAVCRYSPDLIDLSATGHWLVIATRDDLLVPVASALDVATPVPWAETAIFDWGGHACNVADPERFNRLVLKFLRS